MLRFSGEKKVSNNPNIIESGKIQHLKVHHMERKHLKNSGSKSIFKD